MLDKLIIEGKEDTPHIILNKEEGTFLLSGNSLPNNSIKFYSPVIAWIAEYALSPNRDTILTFKMEYFNSSSARIFIEIFHELESLVKQNYYVKVVWYYKKGDHLIEDKGLELQSIVDIPFDMIEE